MSGTPPRYHFAGGGRGCELRKAGGKGKKTDVPLKPPERNTALNYLNFGRGRPLTY